MIARPYRVLYALTALVLAIAPVQAQSVESSVIASAMTGTDKTEFTKTGGTTAVLEGSAARNDTTTGAQSSATARVQTDYGVNRVRVAAFGARGWDSHGDPVRGTAQAEGQSTWNDNWTINRAGHAGQVGSVKLSFRLTGAGSMSNAGALAFFDNFVIFNNANLTLTRTGDVFTTGAISFVYGQKFSVTSSLYVFAGAIGDASFPTSEALGDYFGAYQLETVTLNGGVGSDARLSVASGSAYSSTTVIGGSLVGASAVPEAGTAGLLGLGAYPLVGILVRRRKALVG